MPSPSIPPHPATRNQPGLLETYNESPVLKPATMATVPETVEGRTMLYKGGALTKMASIFNNDGSLNLSKLYSTPPTDFHPTRPDLLSFTKHLDIAEQYANFVQHRVPAEEGVVLCFAVPYELLDDHGEIFGRDWQRLVYWSRGPAPQTLGTPQVPSDLTQFTNTPLLIGYICGTASDKVATLSNSSELADQYMKTKNEAMLFSTSSSPSPCRLSCKTSAMVRSGSGPCATRRSTPSVSCLQPRRRWARALETARRRRKCERGSGSFGRLWKESYRISDRIAVLSLEGF